MKENKSLADFLKNKRIESGFSQLDIAKKLGYTSPQFISNWERGLSNPPIYTLRKLTEIYQIPPDTLFEIALKTIISQITLDMRKKFYGKKGKR
ncbi:MAG TPA: helix-turn-helix transcriptional regulator [Pseudobdellovibrionaceae bacterium]|jgi:transcriptional regulator with XRE-family HTH domain